MTKLAPPGGYGSESAAERQVINALRPDFYQRPKVGYGRTPLGDHAILNGIASEKMVFIACNMPSPIHPLPAFDTTRRGSFLAAVAAKLQLSVTGLPAPSSARDGASARTSA